jgi:cyclophilin family peptidyl-prolyl cis-trans isomerase
VAFGKVIDVCVCVFLCVVCVWCVYVYRLDGKNVAFGKVIDGLELVRFLET